MERRSKTINFSLSPQQYEQLGRLASTSGRNRSELMRSLITSSMRNFDEKDMGTKYTADGNNRSLADTLKDFWSLRASTPLEVVVTGLVIAVNDDGKVLIAKRHQPDAHVPNLTWSFPGSRLQTLDLERELTKTFLQRTSLHVTVNKIIAARVVPESGRDGTQVVAIYAYGTAQGQQHGVSAAPYSELKWVNPLDVFQYFTSSTTDEVTAFLSQLNTMGSDPK